MRVAAWWPYAPALQLIRIHPDGSRYPVRNAFSLETTTETRTNWATNPSMEQGLNGYVPDAGNPTLERVVPGVVEGDSYLRATVAAAGNDGVTVPNSLPGGLEVTIGFDLFLPDPATSFTVRLNWVDVEGLALAPVSVQLSANDINRSVGQFNRQVAHLQTPSGGFSATVTLIAGGIAASSYIALDKITAEQGQTSGTYFDGDTPGATWLGLEDFSASALAPVITVDDGECPFDVSVTYELSNPAPAGGTMSSAPSVLYSDDTTWLTHPSDSTNPIRVIVDSVPVLTRKARQGVFEPIGTEFPVVVSERTRSSYSGEIDFWVVTREERTRLRDLFEDMQPVLLRAPADYGYDDNMWLSLGDLREDPKNRIAQQGTRMISAPFRQVAPPDELTL
jgi:hypothetical protein